MRNHYWCVAMAVVMAWQGVAEARSEWSVGGLIAVEAVSTEEASDLTLATLELGIAVEINDQVSAEVVLLYEEESTPLEVDVAMISVAPAKPWRIDAGKGYVPFGVFDSFMLSAPLTLQFGETRESLLRVDYATDGLWTTAYLFNGDNSGDALDNWGMALGWEREQGDLGLRSSISYINDIGESDTLQEHLAGTVDNIVQERVSGVGAQITLVVARYSLLAEYVAAVDSFEVAELDFQGRGARPAAWGLELGHTRERLRIALGVQGSREAEALALPEQRLLALAAYAVAQDTTLAIEVARDRDYAGELANTLTAQLAVEF